MSVGKDSQNKIVSENTRTAMLGKNNIPVTSVEKLSVGQPASKHIRKYMKM